MQIRSQQLGARGVSMDKTSWAAQEHDSTFVNLDTMARFQQKQLQEKEQKLLQLYDQQQQRAYQVVQRGSAGSNSSNHSSTTSIKTSTTTTSTSQGGKVRQMFDERRQTTVKGIDRSYPLEPLENKLRKQTNANGVATQRNGNPTVNRQSVSVRRVARADVNSNVNNGKPVVSYHEEITRESLEPPAYHYNDEDEYGLVENRVATFANGHYRHDADNEEKIALDQETIERNRMMAKIHLMGFDETLKHRVRNDLESEEFPEYLMADISDKLPKKNATKKLTQAEARLERFRNANAKGSDVPKQSTSNKRSKQTVPTRSNFRWSEITGTSPTSAKSGSSRSSERNRTILDSAEYFPVANTRATNELSKGQRKSYDIESQRDTLQKLFRNATKTQTNWHISPRSNEFKSVTSDGRIFTRHGPSLRFFCRETERSGTTMSIDRKPDSSELLFYRGALAKRNKSPHFFLNESERSYKTNKSKSLYDRGIISQQMSPRYLRRESRQSKSTLSTDRNTTKSESPDWSKEILIKRNTTPQYFDKEIKTSLDRKTTDSPKLDEEEILNNRNKPQFFCKESERSATTMLIKPRSNSTDFTKSILKQRNYDSDGFYKQSVRSSPLINKKISYTPSRLKREVKKDLNKNSTPQTVAETYRSPNLSSATSASSIVSLKYSLEFDNIFQSAKPARKFLKSQNGKTRRLPLKRNINNINTPSVRDNLSKNRYKTLPLSREVKLPSIENKKKITFEISRKSITPTEVDRETQEITMTDHRIEYDKVRKTPTLISKRQIDEIYDTKSPSNKIKSKLGLTYPVSRTRKQGASVLESSVFKPKASTFKENKISKHQNDSEGSVISLSKLGCSSKSGSSRSIITPIRLYSSLAEKNKSKIPETREKAWNQTIRNQSKERKNRQHDALKNKNLYVITNDKYNPERSKNKNKNVAADDFNAEIDVNYQTKVESASNRQIKDHRKITRPNSNASTANKDVFFRLTTREPSTKLSASKKIISPTKVCSRQHCTKSSISPRNSLRKIAEISRSADISKALLSRRIVSKANQSFTPKSPNKIQHKIGKEMHSAKRLTKIGNLTKNQQRSTQSSVRKRLFESDSEKEIPKERLNLSYIGVRNKGYSCLNLKFRDNETVLKVSSFKNFDHKIKKKSKSSEEISIFTVKPLRSIKDIRKSIDNEQNKLIVAKKSRPVIANWRSISPENVDVILKNLQNPTRLTKVTSRVSRITKSPSPDSAATKQLKTSTRGNAPASPSKSYDVVLKRASANPKNQDAKPLRKSTKDADSIGSKATPVEAIDTTDGVVLQNDSLYESMTKVSDVASSFDDQPLKESNTIPSKRPSIKKPFTDKQQTASNASDRPISSVSSNSSANSTQSQNSNTKSKMTTRTKTSADNLVACNICGRNFARDRISYHEQICIKTTNKKRKKFNTTMFRVRGTELEPFVKKGLSKKQETMKKPEASKSNWRRKHEDFINTIRSAKQYQAAVAKGINPADLPPPPPSDTSDYIQCPHCSRKFNEAAAERHISKCKNMLHNKPMHMRAKLRR